MLKCQCGKEISHYRVFGSYIPLFHDEGSDREQVAQNGPILMRYGAIFKPHAHIECSECGRIYLYSIKANLLADMELMDNQDLWEMADIFRKSLEK